MWAARRALWPWSQHAESRRIADTGPDQAIEGRRVPQHGSILGVQRHQAGDGKKEGHAIEILSEASVVPSGVVHLMELQEKGWSYIRP
jgi:hypothetical protein